MSDAKTVCCCSTTKRYLQKKEQNQNASEWRDYLLGLYKHEGPTDKKSYTDSRAILEGHEIKQDDAIAQ